MKQRHNINLNELKIIPESSEQKTALNRDLPTVNSETDNDHNKATNCNFDDDQILDMSNVANSYWLPDNQ